MNIIKTALNSNIQTNGKHAVVTQSILFPKGKNELCMGMNGEHNNTGTLCE